MTEKSRDELESTIMALRHQVTHANHTDTCAYWVWDWNYSWHETDCTCNSEIKND